MCLHAVCSLLTLNLCEHVVLLGLQASTLAALLFAVHPVHTEAVSILINTLRPRRNGRHVPDDIFKYIFYNENVWISLKISLTFVPKVRINHISALVPIMAWRRPGDKPLSEPMMVSLLTHIGVTRPHWVNTQWHDVSRDLGSHFEWRYLAEKVSGNHRQPTTFHWKYSFEVIIGSADALPQLGAAALVVTIMIQFRSLYINDWLIDLRTAQVYWDAIVVVSQEVYLNFHHFCG